MLRKDRISSRFGEDIEFQRGCRDSTMSSHSMRASVGELVRRWLKSVFMAVVSGEVGSSGMRRTSRPGGC